MRKIFYIFLLTSNIAYSNELKTITTEGFIAKNPSPERQAIVDYIIQAIRWKNSKPSRIR